VPALRGNRHAVYPQGGASEHFEGSGRRPGQLWTTKAISRGSAMAARDLSDGWVDAFDWTGWRTGPDRRIQRHEEAKDEQQFEDPVYGVQPGSTDSAPFARGNAVKNMTRAGARR